MFTPNKVYGHHDDQLPWMIMPNLTGRLRLLFTSRDDVPLEGIDTLRLGKAAAQVDIYQVDAGIGKRKRLRSDPVLRRLKAPEQAACRPASSRNACSST